MLRIKIKTASKERASQRETSDLVFGDPDRITIKLSGLEGESQAISISGTNGSVLYGTDTIDPARRESDGKLAHVDAPFQPNTITVVDVNLPIESLGLLILADVSIQSNQLGCYLEQIQIEDDHLGIRYSGNFEGPLTPDVNTSVVRLTSDFTVVGDDELPAEDIEREEISVELMSIRPEDTVILEFNHAIDLKSFFSKRKPVGDTGARIAQSFSIRYVSTRQGQGISQEILASESGDGDWVDASGPDNLRYGTYYWDHSHKRIVIAPPEGGWLYGKYVRIELDYSISDPSGNHLKGGRDQVFFMRVSPQVSFNITEPRKETTYLPWQSKSEEGDPSDFYVTVSGTVSQSGAEDEDFIQSIYVEALNGDDEDSCRVGHTIRGGSEGYDHLRDGDLAILSDNQDGGKLWQPGRGPNDTAKWSINLPLQHSKYQGAGAQAVAEKRYKWRVIAIATTATGGEIKASQTKIVYHEIFKPCVTSVSVSGADGQREVYRREGGRDVWTPLKLTARDVGTKTFSIKYQGDFPDTKCFSYVNSYNVSLANIYLNTDVRQSDDVSEGDEEAETTLAPFVIDDSSDTLTSDGRPLNNTKHTLTIAAKTKANSPILWPVEYEVDTVPLDVVKAEAVPFNQLG